MVGKFFKPKKCMKTISVTQRQKIITLLCENIKFYYLLKRRSYCVLYIEKIKVLFKKITF